jgi:uncharacterized protein (TIGR03435 family)
MLCDDALDGGPGHERALRITCRFAGHSEYPSVFDETGLDGRWDFTLNFSPAPPAQSAANSGDSAGDPTATVTLPDALRRQLGIRMEMQKQPVEILVIEHVERKPTEN